jgi:hypothetical protein
MEVNEIKTWWSKGPSPGNFGDILTPFLLKELFNYTCVYAHKPFPQDTLLGVGSIISHAEGNSVVWGSGMISMGDPLKRDARYLSVRGPVTYEALRSRHIECPPIFGDPALLTPLVFDNPNIKKIYEYGVFAHYVDTELVSKWYADDPNINIINPLNSNPTQVIKQLLQCKRIISSSLHGVIISHAYNIPAVWVKHSNKLSGDGTKFKDYYESVKLKPECIDFQERILPEDLGKFNYQVDIEIDIMKVLFAMKGYLDGK